jgi:hypothetical protein
MNGDRGFLHSFSVWTVPVSLLRIRGELAIGAHLRATDLYTVGSFDPDHDAVMRIGGEAPGGGPILSVGIKCHVRIRLPATSDRQFGSRLKSQRERRMVLSGMLVPVSASGRWTYDDALQWLASGDKAPERDDQFACQRDDHCLARANTTVSGAGAIPHCERALLLKHQKAPGELDHAAADPGVAGSGETLFAPLRAALIRRAC